MTELIQQASDDQLALAICLGAVAASGLIMYFSHHVGRLTGHIRLEERPARPELSIHSEEPVHTLPVHQTTRREKAA